MDEVYVERTAEKDLKKLSRQDFQRIVSHLYRLKETPRPQGCRKIKGSKNDWRIRVGDLRIVYQIDDKKRLINVMRVRHRSEAYR
jgi:mRNA interferase RelE/StbE